MGLVGAVYRDVRFEPVGSAKWAVAGEIRRRRQYEPSPSVASPIQPKLCWTRWRASLQRQVSCPGSPCHEDFIGTPPTVLSITDSLKLYVLLPDDSALNPVA